MTLESVESRKSKAESRKSKVKCQKSKARKSGKEHGLVLDPAAKGTRHDFNFFYLSLV